MEQQEAALRSEALRVEAAAAAAQALVKQAAARERRAVAELARARQQWLHTDTPEEWQLGLIAGPRWAAGRLEDG
jgi:hypothetical protein